MLFCIVVLLTHTVCIVIVSQTANVAAANNFPPQILSNFTYLTPELSVAPQYFSVQLHRIVDKNVAESIVYTPNVNGDRLSSKSNNNTPSSTLQMFAANDGYILKNHLYNDQLCLDNYNHFKMLTRPLGLNLPNDCLLYVEMDEVYTNNTSIEYVKNVYNDLCVKSTSPGGYDDRFTFRLYTKVKSERWYVVVLKNKLSSTSVKRKASVFGVAYNLCLNKVNGNFVCLLSRKNSNCDLKKKYEDSVEEWKRGIVEKITSTTTVTFTSISNDTTTPISATDDELTDTDKPVPLPPPPVSTSSFFKSPNNHHHNNTNTNNVFSVNDIFAAIFQNNNGGGVVVQNTMGFTLLLVLTRLLV